MTLLIWLPQGSGGLIRSRYNSTMFLHTHISTGGLTIGPVLAAGQRLSVTHRHHYHHQLQQHISNCHIRAGRRIHQIVSKSNVSRKITFLLTVVLRCRLDLLHPSIPSSLHGR
jgi:hypothetical protein